MRFQLQRKPPLHYFSFFHAGFGGCQKIPYAGKTQHHPFFAITSVAMQVEELFMKFVVLLNSTCCCLRREVQFMWERCCRWNKDEMQMRCLCSHFAVATVVFSLCCARTIKGNTAVALYTLISNYYFTVMSREQLCPQTTVLWLSDDLSLTRKGYINTLHTFYF